MVGSELRNYLTIVKNPYALLVEVNLVTYRGPTLNGVLSNH